MTILDLSPLNLNSGFELMFLHWVLLNYIDIFISIEIWLFKFSYDYLEWVRWEITFVHEIIQDFLRILLDTHDVKGGLGFGAIIRAIVMWEKVRRVNCSGKAASQIERHLKFLPFFLLNNSLILPRSSVHHLIIISWGSLSLR